MLIVTDWLTMAAHWRHWEAPILLRLLAAATVGVVIGSLVVGSVSEVALQRIIAVAMLAFAGYYVLTKTRLSATVAVRSAWPAGLVGGLSSSLAHLGGPPVFTYLLTTDLSPRRLVATSAALFTVINLLKVPAYVLAGLLDADLVASTWPAWLAIPVGVLAGRTLVGHINRTAFDRITTALLAAGAIILLVT
jgi:uncharacterized membrane protein YfcA